MFNKKLNNIFKDRLFFDTFIVFFGSTFGGALNLLYHFISVRLLNPADYGTVNALISLMFFTSMAVSPLATTFTRFFTEYIAKKDFLALRRIVKKISKRLFIFAAVLSLIFIFAVPRVSGFLNTETVYVFLCALIIILSLFSPLFTSLIQSFQSFKILSFVGVISSLGKLLLGTLLMCLGLRVIAGLSGFLAGSAISIAGCLLFLPYVFKKNAADIKSGEYKPVHLSQLYSYFFFASISMVSFGILTSVDTVLVKHFFSEVETGYYSIAQTVAKVALFLPSSLATVIFPKSTHAYVKNASPFKMLYKAIFLAAVLSLIFTAVCFLFPLPILRILAGKPNQVSAGLIGMFSLAMSFYAVVWVIVNFFLAVHDLRFILPLSILAIGQATAIYLSHATLTGVVKTVLLFSFISFITVIFFSIFRRRV